MHISKSAAEQSGLGRKTLAAVLASAVCFGFLSLGVAGVAGAASSNSSSNSQDSGMSKAFAQDLKHFDCGSAQHLLGRAQRLTAKFQKRDASLTAHLAKVQKAGKTKRIKFFEARLAAAQKEEGRLMNKKFDARMAKLGKLAQEKCHVSASATT